MNKEILSYLKMFYDSLKTQLIEQKKYQKNTSLLGSIMDLKSNARYSFLQKSAILSYKIPNNILETLISDNHIQELDQNIGNTITARGVYLFETENNLYDINSIISYLDNKYFKINSAGLKLSDKEKVILFLLICIRAFSKESVLDLKKGESILNEILVLLNECYNFLFSQEIISSLKKDDLFGKKGNEHPVSNLIRHSDALLKKTKGIYRTIYPQKYYLEISKDKILDIHSLGYLFWQIFGNKFQISKRDDIISYCSKTAYNIIVNHIFDIKMHIYQHPKYDNSIDDAIFEYFQKRRLWAKNAETEKDH